MGGLSMLYIVVCGGRIVLTCRKVRKRECAIRRRYGAQFWRSAVAQDRWYGDPARNAAHRLLRQRVYRHTAQRVTTALELKCRGRTKRDSNPIIQVANITNFRQKGWRRCGQSPGSRCGTRPPCQCPNERRGCYHEQQQRYTQPYRPRLAPPFSRKILALLYANRILDHSHSQRL